MISKQHLLALIPGQIILIMGAFRFINLLGSYSIETSKTQSLGSNSCVGLNLLFTGFSKVLFELSPKCIPLKTSIFHWRDELQRSTVLFKMNLCAV